MVAAAGAVIAANLVVIPNSDYWWHLAIGRLVEQLQAIPHANYFVYTSPAQEPVFYESWLSRWWLFKIHGVIGDAGVATVRSILAGAVGFMVTWPKTERGRTDIAVSAGILASTATWYVGPSMFGAVLISVAALVIMAVRYSGASRYWLLAAIAMPFWVNVDSHFWVVPALLWAVSPGAGEAKRWFWGAGIASILLAFANPAGALVFPTLASFEFNPFGTLIGVGLLALIVHRVRSKNSAYDSIAVAMIGTVVAAFSAVPWLAAVVFPWAFHASDTKETPFSKWAVGAGFAAIVAIVTMPLFSHMETVRLWFSDARKTPPAVALIKSNVPVEEAQLIAGWGRLEPVYHPPEAAGVLAWYLSERAPQRVLATAPNPALNDEKSEVMHAAVRMGDTWRGVFQQYGIRIALLNKKTDYEFAANIASHPDWQVVRERGDWIVLSHRLGPGASK